MRKRSLLLAAGACLATFTLIVGTAGTAVADPPSGTFRLLAGVGSDTTERVMNGLAGDTSTFAGITIGGTKVIASYDASPAGNIQTKATGCTFPRPSGSGNGVTRLVTERNAVSGCLQFARSSANDSGSRNGQHLTYIPFAVDAVAYAVRNDSAVSRRLSKDTLKKIYNCELTPAQAANFKPLLPQSGSGTRRFFLTLLGLEDVPNYTTLHPCVSDKDANNNPLLENSGKLLSDPKHLVPYSDAVWISQTARTPGVDPDDGKTYLGNIDGTNSLTPNVQLTYAVRNDSSVSRNLSLATLKSIYGCTLTPAQQANFKPLLPQPGSAARTAWFTLLGIPDAPCSYVKDVDANNNPLLENSGKLLFDPKHLVPYSVPVWISQTARTPGVAPDDGKTYLGNIDAVPSVQLNGSSVGTRDVYNVLPNRLVAEDMESQTVFVGGTSEVCMNTTTIKKFGFAPHPACGDTSIKTDPDLGPVKGPGE